MIVIRQHKTVADWSLGNQYARTITMDRALESGSTLIAVLATPGGLQVDRMAWNAPGQAAPLGTYGGHGSGAPVLAWWATVRGGVEAGLTTVEVWAQHYQRLNEVHAGVWHLIELTGDVEVVRHIGADGGGYYAEPAAYTVSRPTDTYLTDRERGGLTYLTFAAATTGTDDGDWTVNSTAPAAVDSLNFDHVNSGSTVRLSLDVYAWRSPTATPVVPLTFTHTAADAPGDGNLVAASVDTLVITDREAVDNPGAPGGLYTHPSYAPSPYDPTPSPRSYSWPAYSSSMPGYSPSLIGGSRGVVRDKLRLLIADRSGVLTDRLDAATEITTDRTPLGVGTLNVTFAGTSLAPVQSDALAAGRTVVLEANTADGWEPLFTGTLTTPTNDDHTVTVSALDADGTLDAYLSEDCVPDVAMIEHVALGSGVPVDVSPSVTAVVAGKNPKASALDQVCIARDSVQGYAWTTRAGVLVGARADSRSATLAATWTEDDYARLTVDRNTHQLINDVRVKWLRYLPESGATEPISYGPYRDAASINQWAPKIATFTLCGPTEDASTIAAYAHEVLGRNAQPLVIPRSVTLPLKRAGDVAPGKALVDLGDLVRVTNASRGVDSRVRVGRVRHEITPDRWTLTVDFDADGFVAKPFEVPDPENGHGHYLDDLADVETSTATEGQYLSRVDGTWVAVDAPAGGGGATTLAGLDDVTVATPATGHVLTYEYTTGKWTNGPLPTPATPDLALNDLTDVSGTPTTGHVLTYRGSINGWQPVALPTIPQTLDDLSGVNATSPATGATLVYKGSVTGWVAEVPAAGGTAVTETIYADADAFTVASGLTLTNARMVRQGSVGHLLVTVSGVTVPAGVLSTALHLGTVTSAASAGLLGMGTSYSQCHGTINEDVAVQGYVSTTATNMRRMYVNWSAAAVSSGRLTFMTTLYLS